MFIAFVLLGMALILFGGLVLLRYSDRPGGSIKAAGVEIHSSGAGIPLIALGLACLAFAATRFPPAVGGGTPSTDPSGRVTASSPSLATDANAPSASGPDCIDEWLTGLPPDRIRFLEAGMRDVEVLGSHQPLDTPFAVVLTEGGERIGALRLRLYRASDSSADLYRIESAVDAECSPVTDLQNASRGGDPRALVNWDVVRLRLGENRYDLRIGGEGDVGVNLFRLVH